MMNEAYAMYVYNTHAQSRLVTCGDSGHEAEDCNHGSDYQCAGVFDPSHPLRCGTPERISE